MSMQSVSTRKVHASVESVNKALSRVASYARLDGALAFMNRQSNAILQ